MIKVTYLDHSGFLVELEDAYFLFDYYKGRLPQIDLEKKMFVFVSHVHHDHYRKDIFNLRKHFRVIAFDKIHMDTSSTSGIAVDDREDADEGIWTGYY